MKENFNIFKRSVLTKGSFTQNIAIFTTGSFLAYLIGFVFTPIITRIYTPEDYGTFAFFNTLTAILVAIGSFSYGDALILPKIKKDFYSLAQVVFVIALFLSTCFYIFLFFLKSNFLQYFEIQRIGNWVYLAPLFLLLTTLQQIADAYNIREKRFGVNSLSKIISVVSGKSLVAGLGLSIGSSIGGLISGEITIRTIEYIGLTRKKLLLLPVLILNKFNWNDLKKTAIDFIEYPRYIFPSAILLQFSNHLPVFIILKEFSSQSLGYYALAMSLLGIPVQIIGFSVGKVFLQKSNEMVKNNLHELLSINTLKLYYAILIVASFGYGICFSWGVEIFTLVAGSEWGYSGEIAKILSIPLIFQMLGVVLGPIFRVLKYEKTQFKINFISSALTVIMLPYLSSLNIDLNDFISVVAVLLSLRFIALIMAIFAMNKIALLKHLLIGICLITSIFFAQYVIHSIITD